MAAHETAAKAGLAFFWFTHLSLQDDRLLACCTQRHGGVSEGGYATLNLGFHVDDDPGAVLENRERLAAALRVSLDSFVVPQQVHKGRVEVVTADHRGRGARAHESALPATDAMITREPDTVLAVMLADCVPVIIFDPKTRAIGVAHAGWGGTLHHITRLTVEAMQSVFGTDPASVVAGAGPSIGPDTYEVGPDVADRARDEFPHASVLQPKGNGKFLFDLWTSNVTDLVDAGVPREQIEVAAVDTFVDGENFFSHRRDGKTGRFMALAMLRSTASR
jgi:hypothetical protein